MSLVLIPDHVLDQHYEPREREIVRKVRKQCNEIAQHDAGLARTAAYTALRSVWDTELAWIQNTHMIRAGAGLIPLRYNLAQNKLYEVIQWCRREGRPIEIIILKARKMGFTTQASSWLYYQCETFANRLAAIVSYSIPHTSTIASMIDVVHNHIPSGKRFRLDNAEDGKVFDHPHDSVISPLTAGSENTGRGYTFGNIHTSELSTWSSAEASLLSLVNASVFGLTVSTPSVNDSIVHESTAKGAVGPFYEKWRAAERGDPENTLIPFFAPWTWDERYVGRFHSEDHRLEFMRKLDPVDHEYRIKHGLTDEQTLWMRITCMRACGNSRLRFGQEYPITPREAFIASGTQYFDQERLSILAETSKPPFWYGTIAMQET